LSRLADTSATIITISCALDFMPFEFKRGP
jgi:hypothetical protein